MPMLGDFFSRAVDGAFAVNAQQRIVFWDSGCARLLGVTAQDALGCPCHEVARGRDAKGRPFCTNACDIARLPRGKPAPGAFPLRVTDARGDELKLAVNIVLIPSRRGAWSCVHLLHRGEAPATLPLLESEGWQKRRTPKADAFATDPAGPVTDSMLTSREQEIYRLLAEGLSVSTISHRLHISPVTVRNHLQHIMSKLGLHSQTAAVAYAYRHDLF